MTTGLVIGKFYPPHRGHRLLIETAQAQVDRLTVIVCDTPGQTIPARLRADWLREIHPRVEVMVIDDRYDAQDSRVWAENCRLWLGYAPDAVFTSEAYGAPFAAFLGSRHVAVDPDRIRVPCSGTAIRRDPLAHWGFLEPCVRAYYVPRIAVVGAESTGTTTLAQALAAHFGTVWVPEYGRDYWAAKVARAEQDAWRTQEFVHIAEEQNRLEDAAARAANRLLFVDSPAFATALWHERYLGFRAPEVDAVGGDRPYHAFLLTGDEIHFVQDGFRDGEHIRHQMHAEFIEWLETKGRPFLLLSGPPERRLAAAVNYIKAQIPQRWGD